jgi:hypothetical protein
MIISYVLDDSERWDWIQGVKMSQAYPSFNCNKFTIHCNLDGCIIVNSFDEWAWDICLKNTSAAAGNSIY